MAHPVAVWHDYLAVGEHLPLEIGVRGHEIRRVRVRVEDLAPERAEGLRACDTGLREIDLAGGIVTWPRHGRCFRPERGQGLAKSGAARHGSCHCEHGAARESYVSKHGVLHL